MQGPRSPARARTRQQGRDVRLQGLRRLLAAGHRLPLPRIAVRQEPAQRPLRRHARRQVRSPRLRVHLGPRLRPHEVRRLRAGPARPRPRHPGRIPPRHVELGQRAARPRPHGARCPQHDRNRRRNDNPTGERNPMSTRPSDRTAAAPIPSPPNRAPVQADRRADQQLVRAGGAGVEDRDVAGYRSSPSSRRTSAPITSR